MESFTMGQKESVQKPGNLSGPTSAPVAAGSGTTDLWFGCPRLGTDGRRGVPRNRIFFFHFIIHKVNGYTTAQP